MKRRKITGATSFLGLDFNEHSDHQSSSGSCPFWSLCLWYFLDLGNTSDPSSELLFFISVPKVTSIAHNQSIISDSLLKMTARFWLFSESTFPKVKSGSVSLNLESLRVIFLQETTKPWRLLHLNLLPPHFLSESEIHFLKPQNAQSLT